MTGEHEHVGGKPFDYDGMLIQWCACGASRARHTYRDPPNDVWEPWVLPAPTLKSEYARGRRDAENDALERAAKIADECERRKTYRSVSGARVALDISTAIRALKKEKP